LKEVWLVFLGGGLGSAARFLIASAVQRNGAVQFPYGTIAVNVAGCFLIGFLMALVTHRFIANSDLRLFVTIGILGGFTTFSSFTLETLELFRAGHTTGAIANIFLTVIVCLTATWLGAIIGEQV